MILPTEARAELLRTGRHALRVAPGETPPSTTTSNSSAKTYRELGRVRVLSCTLAGNGSAAEGSPELLYETGVEHCRLRVRCLDSLATSGF